MENVTLAHAKEHLEELIERAARGEDVRISDPKVGTVRLTAVGGDHAGMQPKQPFPERVPGLMVGRTTIPDEKLFEPLSEAELSWLSGESSP